MEIWMTEGPRVNFVMREALYEIYTWILCLSYLHEKQTSWIQSLYLYFIKIVPFWLFKYTTGRYSEQPLEQPAHTSPMFLHGEMDVKIFLMFIVADNTGSVNIWGWAPIPSRCIWLGGLCRAIVGDYTGVLSSVVVYVSICGPQVCRLHIWIGRGYAGWWVKWLAYCGFWCHHTGNLVPTPAVHTPSHSSNFWIFNQGNHWKIN